MSERRRFRLRPQTLAAKFLLIVFLGALLPLALVGVWLTHSAERSGTTLLRTQLESAADAIVAGVDHRWAVREGELQLLANNTAARDALTNDALSSADAAYLSQLARVVGGSIPSIMYVDLAGRERWSSTRDRPREAAAIERPDASRLETPQRTLRVELPVALEGRMIGRVVAGVRLASVVSGDSSRVLIPGARVTLVGANGVASLQQPQSVCGDDGFHGRPGSA